VTVSRQKADEKMTEDRRVALITGAATGIGRATAVALAAAGFNVVVNYFRSERAARETAKLAEEKGFSGA
jgi:NAD(P)-dependent dehydrogenase (short-subunit alcohol dehydrogenase family)